MCANLGKYIYNLYNQFANYIAYFGMFPTIQMPGLESGQPVGEYGLLNRHAYCITGITRVILHYLKRHHIIRGAN